MKARVECLAIFAKPFYDVSILLRDDNRRLEQDDDRNSDKPKRNNK